MKQNKEIKLGPFDPNLREAAKEFTALCKKYDCMGSAVFVSKTHSEYINEIEPSWSLMRKEPPNRIRFKSSINDFNSKEDQLEATEASVHGVTSMVEWGRQTHMAWKHVLDQLSKHMRIMYRVWNEPDSVPGD